MVATAGRSGADEQQRVVDELRRLFDGLRLMFPAEPDRELWLRACLMLAVGGDAELSDNPPV